MLTTQLKVQITNSSGLLLLWDCLLSWWWPRFKYFKINSQTFSIFTIYFCRFLEETNCVGMCTNLCKMPSQLFIKDTLGMSVNMVPSKYKLIPNTNTHYSKNFHYVVVPNALFVRTKFHIDSWKENELLIRCWILFEESDTSVTTYIFEEYEQHNSPNNTCTRSWRILQINSMGGPTLMPLKVQYWKGSIILLLKKVSIKHFTISIFIWTKTLTYFVLRGFIIIDCQPITTPSYIIRP